VRRASLGFQSSSGCAALVEEQEDSFGERFFVFRILRTVDRPRAVLGRANDHETVLAEMGVRVPSGSRRRTTMVIEVMNQLQSRS